MVALNKMLSNYKNVKVLIPARSGSKGIANKNLKCLSGKPLIDHTIQEALKVFSKHDIFLSSDGLAILDRARELGINAIQRPAAISKDDSNSDELITHFLNEYNFHENPTIIYLQPTSPLRTAKNIIEAHELFVNMSQGTLISVSESKQTPYKALKLNSNNELHPVVQINKETSNRQQLPLTFYPNGAIYIFKGESFLEKHCLPEPKIPYIMQTGQSIDIDDMLDFALAELLKEKQDGI